MYTDWSIRAKIKPEYLETVKYFIDNDEWKEPVPEFISKWRKFLTEIGYSITNPTDGIVVYEYVPPWGLSGKWDYHNRLEGDTWVLCGKMKNYKNQIQVFLSTVLVNLSFEITQCWSSSDFVRDSVACSDDDDIISTFSDNEIRKMITWTELPVW